MPQGMLDMFRVVSSDMGSTSKVSEIEPLSSRIREIQLLEEILDIVEREITARQFTPQTQRSESDMASMTIPNRASSQSNPRSEREILESFVNYHGTDPVVRKRLGLPPSAQTENLSVEDFDARFATRFGATGSANRGR
jgi:hypothetical protein